MNIDNPNSLDQKTIQSLPQYISQPVSYQYQYSATPPPSQTRTATPQLSQNQYIHNQYQQQPISQIQQTPYQPHLFCNDKNIPPIPQLPPNLSHLNPMGTLNNLNQYYINNSINNNNINSINNNINDNNGHLHINTLKNSNSSTNSELSFNRSSFNNSPANLSSNTNNLKTNIINNNSNNISKNQQIEHVIQSNNSLQQQHQPPHPPHPPQQQPYRQFVTTLLDSSTNKLVQITSQPPPDYIAVKKRRNRISISCMSCKRRKVKCDRERPLCGSCKKHGYTICVYSSNVDSESTTNKIQKNDDYIDENNSNDEYIEKSNEYGSNDFNNLLIKLDKIKVNHMCDDDIDQLRKKIEHLKFYLDDENVLNSKILKGIKQVQKMDLNPVLQCSPSVSLDSFNSQFGASSITSYVNVDKYMGVIFKKSLKKIESDMEIWKSKFSVEIYRAAVEKIIISNEYILDDKKSSINEVKRSKFRAICKLLENYFIDYETFINILNNSVKIMLVAVPVAPKKLIDKLTNDHFLKSEDGKLIIVNNDSDDQICETLLILAILRFGMPKSENVIITPDEINFSTLLEKENINTDNKTDLLNSFLKVILNEIDLSQRYNIPMLGTLIIFFMISYTHRFNFKSGNPTIGLNYGIMAIYMAVNLGVYGDYNFDKNSNDKNLKYFTDFDYNNIWNLIMFIDTFSSFNSGMPQLISSSLDNIYVTSFVDRNCADICIFYRKAFRLSNKRKNKNSANQNVSIIQYERFVIEFESFIFTRLDPASICINKNDLVGVATSIRALNLLLFLYYNSYFSFINTINIYRNENSNIEPSMDKEFKEFEERLFRRCIKLSIISLIDLNVMLVSLFSAKDESFYEKYSFDLIQIFTRIIYTLTSCLCKMIADRKKDPSSEIEKEKDTENEKEDDEDFSFLFDIPLKSSENLSNYFVGQQCNTAAGNVDDYECDKEIIKLYKKVDLLCEKPNAIIKLLIGFFFNTSQSLISQNFMYYSLYKYFVMAVKYFAETPGTPENFNIEDFEARFSNVDCTWFINK